MNTQPNIIFIMADQLAASFIHCYGSGVDSTPTLDSLAGNGIRFTRAYAASPVCGPNRACILTGRSPSVHGVTINNVELTADNPTYAQVLAQQGYHVGGFGKFHHTCMNLKHPDTMERYGFHESAVTEDPKMGEYLSWVQQQAPEWYETATAMAWPRNYQSKEDLERFLSARSRILEPRRQASDWHLMYASPLPKELHQTRFIADKTIDFIERASGNNEPFFCFTSYVDPHDPYDPPAPYDTMYHADDMPDPIPAQWEKRGNAVLRDSQQFNKFDSIAHDVPAIKKLRALYHGSIRFIDDEIRRIIHALEKKNLISNTIIVFTTDHGDMMGDHALITKGVKFFDASVRVPLIVSGADTVSGVSDALVSSLDHFPAFCEWAHIAPTPPLEGHSYVPLCRGNDQSDPWREVTMEAPYYMPGIGGNYEDSVVGIVTADNWRFTIFDRDDLGEMFDLTADPREQNDLYYDKAYSEKKFELFERLTRAFMRRSQIQQYRNLPIQNGKRCLVGGNRLTDAVWQGQTISFAPTICTQN